MSVRIITDPLDFVRKAEKHHGRIPIAELERLQDFLFENQGNIAYQVSGTLDRDGRPQLHLSIEGDLQLCCQRCLGNIAHKLDIDTVLLLAQTEQELEINDADETIDAILAVEIDIHDLLEEEIILSLSISSRHEEGECEAYEPQHTHVTEMPDTKNPFAILKALKKIQH